MFKRENIAGVYCLGCLYLFRFHPSSFPMRASRIPLPGHTASLPLLSPVTPRATATRYGSRTGGRRAHSPPGGVNTNLCGATSRCTHSLGGVPLLLDLGRWKQEGLRLRDRAGLRQSVMSRRASAVACSEVVRLLKKHQRQTMQRPCKINLVSRPGTLPCTAHQRTRG